MAEEILDLVPEDGIEIGHLLKKALDKIKPPKQKRVAVTEEIIKKIDALIKGEKIFYGSGLNLFKTKIQ